jgi:SAM-dependent methyltransferase
VTDDVLDYIRASLPPPPQRVLEVGAGKGELAEALRAGGYDVTAIDPAASTPAVTPVALLDLDEPARSFDAAIAVVSLHHVEPLAESCERLAELVKPGGRLVVDEFDTERFDERAAAWWSRHREGDHHHGHEHAAEMVADVRGHLHSIAHIREELARAFDLSDVTRRPYLYRWELPEGVRPAEEQAIAEGTLAAIGTRFTGTRRS